MEFTDLFRDMNEIHFKALKVFKMESWDLNLLEDYIGKITLLKANLSVLANDEVLMTYIDAIEIPEINRNFVLPLHVRLFGWMTFFIWNKKVLIKITKRHYEQILKKNNELIKRIQRSLKE